MQETQGSHFYYRSTYCTFAEKSPFAVLEFATDTSIDYYL